MPRRREVAKRIILPDPVYGSVTLAKFINHLMLDGKKSVAEKIVYEALEIVGSKVKDRKPLVIFEEVLEKVKPLVEVRSRRVGGATYQVPVEVRASRSMTLAMRWLIEGASGRREKGMGERLAAEILEAVEGRGFALKKREDTHRMAEANKAFAHYRW